MYARYLVIAFSILIVGQSEASAQLFQIFRSANSGSSNCCQSQVQTQTRVQSQTQVQAPAQYQTQAQYQAPVQYQAPTQTQTWVQSNQFEQTQNYPTQIGSVSSAPVETVVNVGSYSPQAQPEFQVQAQPEFQVQTQPEFQVQFQPVSPIQQAVSQEVYPATPLPQPRYGIPTNSPYSTVVGNLPTASEVIRPQDDASNAMVAPTTVMGPAYSVPSENTTIELTTPAMSTNSLDYQSVPTATIPTMAEAPGVVAATNAAQTTPVDATASVVETHTVAPVTSSDVAPGELPGQLETNESEGTSILSTDSGI